MSGEDKNEQDFLNQFAAVKPIENDSIIRSAFYQDPAEIR